MFFHQPFNSVSGNKYNFCVYKGYTWNYHFHKNFELIYVFKGSVECTVNNKCAVLNEGDFGLCLSNEVHSYRPEESAEYWVCVFSGDCVGSFASIVKGKSGEHFKFTCEPSVKAYVEANLINNNEPSFFAFKSCLYAVCDQYLKQVPLVSGNAAETHAMSAIIDFVSTNYKNDIKLSDVAELLGYDYNYTSRYFNKIFNMQFKDFVNLYRLDAATEMLERRDKKLLDIAFESGFQSLRNFNNCFKKHFGVCPSEYMNNIEKK